MQLAGLRQPLDGKDLFPLDIFDSRLAGSDCFIIDDDRAGGTIAFTAPVLCSRDSKIGAQDPQEHPIAVHSELHGLAVELELNSFFHNELLILK
jgi:hypothetical protein